MTSDAADRPFLDRRFGAILALLLVVAVVARWPGLFTGPGYGNVDEKMYVPKAVRYGGGDLNPHYFQNPPLASYVMFAGEAAWYAAGRATGAFASSLDFKAQYLADGTGAFVVARITVLLIALAGIAQVAFLARSLVREGAGAAAGAAAGLLAASVLVVSPLHSGKSTTATNEMLVTVLYTLAVQMSLRLAKAPGLRAALLAGAAAGLCGAAKYTGALAAAPVAAACLASPDLGLRVRVRLLLAAGAACVVAFLVACPWAVIDHATFRAHLEDLFVQRDRFGGASALRRYFEMLWGDGLGPVWTLLALASTAWACVAVARRAADERARLVVVLAAMIPLTLFLVTRPQMANGRYLLPIYPTAIALAAATLVGLPGRAAAWATSVAALATVAWAWTLAPDYVEGWHVLPLRDARDDMTAWMRGHLPDGAYVLTDVDEPWLVRIDERRELQGNVPAATWKRLVPAFRQTSACPYFAGPISDVAGTHVSCADFAGVAALGPAYVLVTSSGRDLYAQLPPGEYPGAAWHEAVAKSLPLVHVVASEGRRGPSVYLYEVRGGDRK